MFAGLLAVVAPHPDVGKAGKRFPQLLQLRVFALLGSENIEAVKTDQAGHIRIALPSPVSVDRIALIGIS